jgi:hypothetical protein
MQIKDEGTLTSGQGVEMTDKQRKKMEKKLRRKKSRELNKLREEEEKEKVTVEKKTKKKKRTADGEGQEQEEKAKKTKVDEKEEQNETAAKAGFEILGSKTMSGENKNGEEKKTKKQKKKDKMKAKDTEEEEQEQPAEAKEKGVFKKCFYTPTERTTSLPQSTIDAFVSEHAVSVVGKGSKGIRPILEFADANLDERCLKCCAKFPKPTPIQSMCWPIVAAGRDVIG